MLHWPVNWQQLEKIWYSTIEDIVINSPTDISVKFSFCDAFEDIMEALSDA